MSNMRWFRFYSETITDIKFQRIARNLQISKMQVVGSWATILCIASDSPVRGTLRVTLRSCYAIEDLCYALDTNAELTQKILDEFISLGMLHKDEDGAICVTNWAKRQFISDEKDPTAAERMRKSRLLRSSYAPVTDLLRPDTESDTDTDTDNTINAPVGASPAPKKPSKADPRTKHPAIIAYREVTGKYPNKTLYDSIITAIGEQPDTAKLTACYQEWVKRGSNPNAATWAIDWYTNGISANGKKPAETDEWKKRYTSA
jgi:hypothetical protein